MLFALTFGCGGDDAQPADTKDAAVCPDLAGTWTITSHCSAALVGTTVMVTQSDCTLTTSGAFPGFTGEVQNDGSLALSGTSSGMSVSCMGVASNKTLTESCSGNCNVTLTR
jgi:hypothetical protein